MFNRKLILQRWLYILALALASYSITQLISRLKWVNKIFQNWSDLLAPLGMFEKVSISLIGIITLIYFLKETKVINYAQHKAVRDQFLFPPIYFSAIFSIILFFTIGPLDFPQDKNLNVIALLLIYFILCAVLYFHHRYAHPEPEGRLLDDSTEKKAPTWSIDSADNESIDLYKWIHSEKPIDQDELDHFQRNIYSERIANQIIKLETAPHHIAITGAFGSGKSSISKTIEANIKYRNPDIIFVFIDGLGRSENSCAAQILEEFIDKLSEYVDCSSIKNIPQAYLDALSGANFSGSQSLTGLLKLRGYENPTKTLRNINSILHTINRRVVIILEDFDRNANSGVTTTELAALLDRLRHLNRINFIINIGQNASSDILSRVCTYKEDLSDIDCSFYLSKFIKLMVNAEIKKIHFHLMKINIP